MDELLGSAKREENLNLDEVLELASKMGVEVRVTPEVKVFKGGIQGGKKVVLIPEKHSEDEEGILAGEVLHELGHIRYEHYGSGSDDPKRFVLQELQANHWALTTKGGYPMRQWDWSILPGIAEDLAEKFGMSLGEAWQITRQVAKEAEVSSSSLNKAEEEVMLGM